MLHGGAKQHNGTLQEPNIMVNSTDMSWQCVCLLPKSYLVDVDDQKVVSHQCRNMLVTVLWSHADDGATEATLVAAQCRC
jgi:hypothetical protein